MFFTDVKSSNRRKSTEAMTINPWGTESWRKQLCHENTARLMDPKHWAAATINSFVQKCRLLSTLDCSGVIIAAIAIKLQLRSICVEIESILRTLQYSWCWTSSSVHAFTSVVPILVTWQTNWQITKGLSFWIEEHLVLFLKQINSIRVLKYTPAKPTADINWWKKIELIAEHWAWSILHLVCICGCALGYVTRATSRGYTVIFSVRSA